tara:strand:+ start:38 stop:952 length:915 start_codon:yes stop_codon:yes gene_type:complete
MNDDDTITDYLDTPLILKNEVVVDLGKNIEILKISDLIKIKYSENSNFIQINNKSSLDRDFKTIKQSAMDMDEVLKRKTFLINNTIKCHETELNILYNEKKLSEQNNLQSDIIKNQKQLIDKQKLNNTDLKSNLNEVEKRLKEKDISIKKFLIDNDELKVTISRYIEHNKKLQDNIIQLKKDYGENPLSKSQIDEMANKINFYQEENIRLSSEITDRNNDLESMKINFTKVELEKNNIFEKIKELNNSLINNNIVSTPFKKENYEDNSLKLRTSDNIIDSNTSEEKIKEKSSKNLNDNINNIFN